MRRHHGKGERMVEARRGRILIVEDEADLAIVLQARLQSAGYEVHTEGFGGTALGYAVENPPDLVILDMLLPDLAGDEVCRELRHLCQPTSPWVIMFTCLDQPVEPDGGFARCADAYLTKRSAPHELFSVIECFLGQQPALA